MNTNTNTPLKFNQLPIATGMEVLTTLGHYDTVKVQKNGSAYRVVTGTLISAHVEEWQTVAQFKRSELLTVEQARQIRAHDKFMSDILRGKY